MSINVGSKQGASNADLLIQFPFPDNYHEMLEHIGQVVANHVFTALGATPAVKEQAIMIGFAAAEAVSAEFGGSLSYVPKNVSYQLSQRDERIWAEFKGDNYHELSRKHGLTEVQIRTICKRALALDRAARQNPLF